MTVQFAPIGTSLSVRTSKIHGGRRTLCFLPRAILAMLMALLLIGALSACKPAAQAPPGPPPPMNVGITGYNFTNEGVQEYYVDGSRGSNLPAYGGGGKTSCCVSLPDRWTPEVMVKVDWVTGHWTLPIEEILPMDMYREAQRCMVPLLTIEQLLTTDVGKRTAADFDIDPACIARFNAYRTWTAGVSAATVDALLQGHMRQYWLWRLRHIGRTDALESHKHASSQDRQDVLESDGDFMQDMADALRERRMYGDADTSGAAVSDAKRDFVKLNAPYAHGAKPDVPPLVHEFFDVMVHDSHASFYMVGPVTAYDQQQKVLQLQARLRSSQEQLQKLLADPRNASRMAGATPDAMLSINELGQRILDHQRHHPGELPLLTDADRAQLLAMEDQRTSATVRLVTRKTRRELGGHIRYRRVFDGS